MARLLALLLSAAIGGSVATASQQAPLDLRALLETYASGQYDDAVKSAVGIEDLGPLRRQFVQDTPEPNLCFPGDLDHLGSLAFLPLLQCIPQRRTMPVAPRRFTHQAAQVAVACFSDRPAAVLISRRLLARHCPAIPHQLLRVLPSSVHNAMRRDYIAALVLRKITQHFERHLGRDAR